MPGVYTTGSADKLIAPTWAGIIETAVPPRVTNIADVRLTTWFLTNFVNHANKRIALTKHYRLH
jgi:hypothetical protein